MLHDVTLDPDTGAVLSARTWETSSLVRPAVEMFSGDVGEVSTLVPIVVVGMPQIDATWRSDPSVGAATCSLSHDGIPVVLMAMVSERTPLPYARAMLASMPVADGAVVDVDDPRLSPRPLLICASLVTAMLAGVEVVELCGDISTCIAAAWAERAALG